MSCHGANAFNPICRIHDAATGATTDAFSNIAGWFGQAAADATTWLWQQIGSATTINLNSPQLAADLAATGAIAGVLCLGLFLIQVITGVLRREPDALTRAAKGLLVALVASVFALSVTKILLGAVDALSDGIVQYAMNTNMAGLGRQLALTNITGAATNPAVVLLFSIVILAAVVVVWAAMMIRKMMIIITAVLTPLAFSGATADITRGWVRKWIEFMAAMIVSKLLLVIILMVGLSVVEGAGQVTHPGPGQVLTQLATGTLILLMGGFAPWVAIRMFHFTGDALHTAHTYAAQAPAGARTVISAPQKVNSLHSQASSAMSKLGNTSRSTSVGQTGSRPHSGQLIYDKTYPAPSPSAVGAGTASASPGPGRAGGGSAGAEGGTGAVTTGARAGGGAVAAAPVVIPAVVAGATVSAAHTAAKTAGQTAQHATSAAATPAPPSTASTPPAPAPTPPPVREPPGRSPTKPT